MGVRVNRFVGVLVAGSMFVSSTGAVAASASIPASPQINPWAALTAMTGGAPAAALCGAAAVAASAQAPSNCVLPVTDAPPPVAQSAPPAPIPVPPVEPMGGGLAFDPLLLGLGALAVGALAYFLLRKNNNNNDNSNSPA
jgi:hypothetical protein